MANKELLTKVHKMVPPMLEHFHKGKSSDTHTSCSLEADEVF